MKLPVLGRAPIDPSLDLEVEIGRLKTERNAVILAHYYQESDIQDVADFIGDSLQLSQAAATTTADVICFAGVHFMAETAKILNPDRTVVVPDMDAGCSLADGCPADKFARWQAMNPDAVTVSYINCSAEVKALSDYIVTSSNAEKIVRQIPADKEVLFAPDKNLGRWLEKRIGRTMKLWQGSCIVHDTFSERKLVALKERHPGALVLAHPECEEAVLERADYIGSTTAIFEARHRAARRRSSLSVTEPGILHAMKKEAARVAPTKCSSRSPVANCACNECPHMKKNTLEKVYLGARDLEPRLEMRPDLIERARGGLFTECSPSARGFFARSAPSDFSKVRGSKGRALERLARVDHQFRIRAVHRFIRFAALAIAIAVVAVACGSARASSMTRCSTSARIRARRGRLHLDDDARCHCRLERKRGPFEGGALDVVDDCALPPVCDLAGSGLRLPMWAADFFQCSSLEQCEVNCSGEDCGAACVNPCVDTLGQNTSNGCDFFPARRSTPRTRSQGPASPSS